jgi:putative hydroxymethylpyrimidine transport system substrate-binding protein
MKKTSINVPMNSARYAAGPRSCTLRPPGNRRIRSPVGFDAVRRILLVIAASTSLAACGDEGSERATLALDFQPNAVHAGIYAALREDLDAARDLDLRVRVPSASTDSLKLLAAGRADVSVVDIHDLGLARQEGQPIVGVGALVQRPLAAVIARRGEIRRPRDLEGRRVGVTGLPSDDAVLRAVVEADGGDFDRVERVTIGFSAVPSLIAERVDAVVSFWNAEGVALRQRGVPTREFRVDDYGAPPYPELVLVTEAATWREERELVEDLLATVADGTRAALRDRDAAVADLVDASGADEQLVRAQLEAVAPALRPPVQLNRRALEDWAVFDTRFGILEAPPDVEADFPR